MGSDVFAPSSAAAAFKEEDQSLFRVGLVSHHVHQTLTGIEPVSRKKVDMF